MTDTKPPSSLITAPVLFGIPNCDQVKKARLWLSEHGIAYRFHDFKKDGLSLAQIEAWLTLRTWEELLNRKGTTWRKLVLEAQPQDRAAALALMLQQPSVIKRPVLVSTRLDVRSKPITHIDIGYNATRYAELFL